MANQVSVFFNADQKGKLKAKEFTTSISFKGEAFAPYELFLGGYVSCLHATFIGIAKKKRLPLNEVSYDVYATKREEVPTVLNYVKTTITFSGITNEKVQASLIKSMKLAEKYCSISYLISTIAKMEFEYHFKS
jgi:putative redox protein